MRSHLLCVRGVVRHHIDSVIEAFSLNSDIARCHAPLSNRSIMHALTRKRTTIAMFGCSLGSYVVQYRLLHNIQHASIHSEPYAIHAHESCMHVAVRVRCALKCIHFEHSEKAAKIFGVNAVQVLATLFLFAGLLCVTIIWCFSLYNVCE